MSHRKSWFRLLSILVAFTVVAAACGGSDKDSSEAKSSDGLGVPTDGKGANNEEALVSLKDVPTADPNMFHTPTPEPDTKLGPDEVYVLTAKEDATFIDTFKEPNGESYTLQYEFSDGEKVDYPLTRDTYFGNKLALQVVEGNPNDTFVKVKLPVRPNGTEAWVQSAWFDWNRVDYKIVLDLAHNKLTLFKGGEKIDETEAAVGREGTETPIITTYIDEKIKQDNADGAYGPWILSLAAFSDTQKTFEGKLPKLAIHGTNQPELIGQGVSHGCIRIHNDFITMLADDVPVGATVEIVTSDSAA